MNSELAQKVFSKKLHYKSLHLTFFRSLQNAGVLKR